MRAYVPQMELVRFDNTASNQDVLNAIRGLATLDYQHRIPEATKANISDVLNALWDYEPARNEFSDALVNVIGRQEVRYQTWTNPLQRFKKGLFTFGETVEEVGVGLLPAYVYSAEREHLEEDIFGRAANEVQSRFHKVNRRNFYKLTINESQLQRAFFNEGGLSQFVTALMSQITTSDNVDEFKLMTSLFPQYEERDGFYRVQVPSLQPGADLQVRARAFLTIVRELNAKLRFVSRAYNAAKLPAAVSGNLELFMTPRMQAVLDVEALSAAFNVGLADLANTTTLIPEEDFGIENATGVLTSPDFFQVYDVKMQMTQAQNPIGLHNNYFYHHWQTISASPFVPAILLTEEVGNEVIVVSTPVTGVSTLTLIDKYGDTVTDASRGDIVQVQGTAQVNTANAPAGWEPQNTGLVFTVDGKRSSRTRITQEGFLIVGPDEAAETLTVTATAVDDASFSRDLTVNVVGPLVQGSIGQSVDEDTATLANKRKPTISPNTGGSGTSFTASNGTWDAEPDSFTYQWKRDGSAISGATADTYAATGTDVGHTLTVTVTATRGSSTAAATSSGVTVA